MALIPPFYFNCVVDLGKRKNDRQINWIGTGTLVGRLFEETPIENYRYHIFIVTNQQVMKNNSSLVVRFNPLH